MKSTCPIRLALAIAILASGSTSLAEARLSASPANVLASNVRLLARQPKNVSALLAAGKAALQIGDTAAAAGFFGRAREAAPGSATAHAGLAATLVAIGNPRQALGEFEQAKQLGARPALIGPDLGLAYDVLGNQIAAQAAYHAALGGEADEQARERLALSLAISGDHSAAATVLQPLLDRGERGAYRTRAFILALSGNISGSAAALDEMSPRAGAAAEPFLRQLASLTPGEKAAALNLGIFPARLAVPGANQSSQSLDDAPADLSGSAVPVMPRPMEYGGALRDPRRSGDQETTARLALYGVFAVP